MSQHDFGNELERKLNQLTGKKFVKVKTSNTAKYANKLTEVDNRIFHSKAEARRYVELKLAKQRKEINDFKCQYPKFVIVPTHTHPITGRVVKELTYTPDFCIKHNDGSYSYEDVKGSNAVLTTSFKDKKKIVEYLNSIEVKIVRM